MKSFNNISTKNGFILILVTLIIAIVIKQIMGFRYQNRLINEANSHIQTMSSEWSHFKNNKFIDDDIFIVADTSPLGAICIAGTVSSKESRSLVISFWKKSNPPRGVDASALRVY